MDRLSYSRWPFIVRRAPWIVFVSGLGSACGPDMGADPPLGPSGGSFPTGGNDSGSGGANSASGGKALSEGPAGGGLSSGGQTASGGEASAGGSGSGGAPPFGGGGAEASGGAPAVTALGPHLNGIQWADTSGKLIQAHGGGMLKVGEDYYWFGENRNPDGTFLAVSAYRSRDLRNFEFVHDVLKMTTDPGLSPANVERPKVVYNASTKKFVMWMHWENGRDYGEARAAVASSDTVDGDYTYHGSFRPLAGSGVMDHGKPGYMSRDCTLYVDDDGQGYFLSAADENYDLNLYRLTPDYLGVAELVATLFPDGHREAPALFKRNETYFLVTSGATGWDPNQAQFATSSSLTTGWSSLANVGDGTTFSSQSTYVLPVTGSEGTEFLYLGDRWAGAYDGRVNDSQYVWLPITFSGADKMSLSYVSTLDIDTTRGHVRGESRPLRFKNKLSGLFLDTADGSGDKGAKLAQSEESSARAQAWSFDYNGSGHFEIKNGKSGQVIDVPNESTESGTELALWDSVGGAHQGFRVVDLGGGNYQFRNQKSGHLLSVAMASGAPGAAIEQAAAGGGDEQIWLMSYAD